MSGRGAGEHAAPQAPRMGQFDIQHRERAARHVDPAAEDVAIVFLAGQADGQRGLREAVAVHDAMDFGADRTGRSRRFDGTERAGISDR